MAELQPFPGVRYDPAACGGDLHQVLAPPFDVISPEEREDLYHRSPYNIVRIEYPKPLPDETPERNRYTQAAHDLRAWLQEGKLHQDRQPALYLVRHEYPYGGHHFTRREVMAAVRLEPWERGVVRPHEHTLPKPKADRLQLLRACRTNISPIYCLYRDAGGALAALLHQIEAGPPTVATGWGAASLRMWAVTEGEHTAALQQALRDAPLYIADGHHRYETALAYRDERRAQEPEATGREAYHYALMGLTAAEDPGLLLLPLHRLVRGALASDIEVLRGRLEGLFDVWQVPLARDPQNVEATAKAITTALAIEAVRRPTVAIYGLEPGYVVMLGAPGHFDTLRRRFMPPEWSAALCQLDVSVLHKVILEPLLSIGQEGGDQGMLTYESDLAAALRAVDRGEYQLACLLHPTRVEQILAVADAGEKMPPKSTFFYPKLPTGLVLHSLEGTP